MPPIKREYLHFSWTTESYYDSPPKNRRCFLTDVLRLLHTTKDSITNLSSHIFLFAKEGLSNDDFGVARGTTVFQETWPGAGFKTDDFVTE